MSKDKKMRPPFPVQKQREPGLESEMKPRPEYAASSYRSADKLVGKRALITGGDSGIGRAVALLFAREGADIAINFLEPEMSDAFEIQKSIKAIGRRCILLPGDLTDPFFCKTLIEQTIHYLGGIDILVSNAAHQQRKSDLAEMTLTDWEKTFRTNIYAYFLLVKEALPYLKAGSSIIATSSQVAATGPADLMDYAATKGAINSFTRCLSRNLIEQGIRVNAVAPGPVWTPLNISDSGESPEKVAEFGKHQPIGRPAQPEEIAPAYVFLASEADSSYVTGCILAETGGTFI